MYGVKVIAIKSKILNLFIKQYIIYLVLIVSGVLHIDIMFNVRRDSQTRKMYFILWLSTGKAVSIT